jgi:hypothetical protein
MNKDFAQNGAIDFAGWLDVAEGRHVDPYTLWTLQTRFRQFLSGRDGATAPQVIDFLVELDQPLNKVEPMWPRVEPKGDAQAGQGAPSGPPLRVQVPEIYRQPIPGPTGSQCDWSHHVTARLPMKGNLQGEGMQEVSNAVVGLMLLSGVKRAQIGFPRAAMAGELPEVPPPMNTISAKAGLLKAEPPKVVLGVLEDGCPFGHASLLRARHSTRVAALWDQSTQNCTGSDAPEGLGYGRHRVQSQLNQLLRDHKEGEGVDEESLYADPRALQNRLRDCGSHAAAVVTLFAGRRAHLPSRPVGMPRERDEASKAPIVAVQFPIEQIDVAGARWLVVRALDGLRYLCQSAAGLAPKLQAPPPLVINMSYGSVTGAHDGTALLETAMDELVRAYGELGIVLAAGNAYGTRRDADSELGRRASGCHAESLLPPGESKTFGLYVPPDKSIESYLELWFEDQDKKFTEEQFLEREDVDIEVHPPVGQTLRVEGFPGLAFDNIDSDKTTAGLICFRRVAQSRLRSMALLVVSATQISSTRVEVASGLWTVKVKNKGSRRLRVQGWVERDLVPRTSRTSQAARLIALPDAEAAPPSDGNTLNNVATGDLVFRAGALSGLGEEEKRIRSKKGVSSDQMAPSPYTSAGREGGALPQLSAVADESPVSAGIRVSGNNSACVLRMNGTSVAAPQAARWLAGELVRGRKVKVILDDLKANSYMGGNDTRRGTRVPP